MEIPNRWQNLSLQWKIFSLFLIIFLVVLILGGFYSYSLSSASRDADLINALGRQRMLSQAMAKSALGYASSQSRKSTIKQQISELDHYITQMRGIYTKFIVGPAKNNNLTISMFPENESHPAIPFPATFTRMINEKFGEDRTFGIDIISDRPINPEKGLKTKVDQEAYNFLTQSKSEIYTTIQEENGKLSMTLYTADRATVKACVSCHIALSGRNFKIGDILGIRKYDLIFANDIKVGQSELYATLEEYKTAQKIFNQTLMAVKSGGIYSIDLAMKNTYQIEKVNDPTVQKIISKVENKFKELQDEVNLLVNSKVNSDPYRKSKVTLLEQSNALRKLSDQLLVAYTAYSKTGQTTIQWIVNISIVLTMLLLIGTGFYLLKMVIRPVQKIRIRDPQGGRQKSMRIHPRRLAQVHAGRVHHEDLAVGAQASQDHARVLPHHPVQGHRIHARLVERHRFIHLDAEAVPVHDQRVRRLIDRHVRLSRLADRRIPRHHFTP